uniref:Sec1 family domain containing 1 n=1 Tax=Neolamprologus brichardi TaxID=32507 RepID=A0A3Q4N8K8_NEOBR
MFILCHQNKELISYHAINRADIQDTDMEAIMDTIVDSLFCFFVTLGAVPIIRCPRGNAAEMVAVKLDKKLRENLRDARNSLFTGDSMTAGQFSFQRPLFVLVDRNVDMATPLHHTWTYQALIHDVLDFHLNRVVMEEGMGAEPSAGARPKKKSRKTYDLTAADKFWQKHKGSPFPEVAESVQEELDTYRAQEDEVKRLKSIMGLEGEDEGAISMLSDNTAKLTSAVSSLPELLEKKRLIDLHTNVATAVLDHIKVYSSFQKLRFNLSATHPKATFLDYQPNPVLLPSASCFPPSCLSSHPGFSSSISPYPQPPIPHPHRLFSRVMNTGSQFVMEGVKNLVLKQHVIRLTKTFFYLILKETDDYRYFDPKMLRGMLLSPCNNRFSRKLHFIFLYFQSKQGKKIVYGCSELFNASQFIKQLSQLGQK